MAKNGKIKKYRKPLNLNIGMLIFGAVFVYVLICVFMYFQTTHVVRYEVKEGSLATNNVYRGIAIRKEQVVTAQAAGHINYFAPEGEKVSSKDLVYTIDETGRLNDYFEDMSLGENSLTAKELAEFRSELAYFMHGFDSRNYEAAYDFKSSLQNTVLKLANANMLEEINDMSGASAGVVNFYNAPCSGVVAYWVDGYETLTADGVTEEIFDEKTEYKKTQLVSNELLAVGDAAYKLTTSENWSLVIPLEDDARGAELEKEGYIKVRFLKNQYESWASVKYLRNGDGKPYLQLDFNNSMISFVSDRFLDVELILHEERGLKIPNSSIVQKEFYLIPAAFVNADGGGSIIRQCYLEDGTISSEVVPVNVYSYDEESEEYYIDSTLLGAGDILHKTDSQETYTVSKRATLTGVYNMNKGYADFKEIQILYQNEEYSIVKANTRYGLNVYDYIVLDAESVSDDQFINDVK